MNPLSLQTLQLMLSMITSDKEAITDAMRKDAVKVIKNLMVPISKDAEELFQLSSSIKL